MRQSGGVLQGSPSLDIFGRHGLVLIYCLVLAVGMNVLLGNGEAPGLLILLAEIVAKPCGRSQTSEDNRVLLDSKDDKDCSYHPGKRSNSRVTRIRDFVCHIARR